MALFGTLFNDIMITRKDVNNVDAMTMKVPISYGPNQKFLAKLQQDQKLSEPAMTLPRMSFELLGMIYNGDRKLTRHQMNTKPLAITDDSFSTQFVAAPYDLEFQLNIMVKYSEDGNKIVEQIVPFFKPDWTASVQIIDNLDFTVDIPIVLQSIATEDTYDGDFNERRVLIWTLNFTMKAQYFGPLQTKKIIKFSEVNLFGSMNANTAFEVVKTQPGLTANGTPTTDITQTIPYANINADDPWDFIVTIEDIV